MFGFVVMYLLAFFIFLDALNRYKIVEKEYFEEHYCVFETTASGLKNCI